MNAATDAGEASVSKYLEFLADPSSARDERAIAAARSAVDAATSPIEKLKALSALERAEAVDGTHLVTGFIRHAKSWADANGITPSAFRQLGVPDDVLRGAGLLGGVGRRGPIPATRGGMERKRAAAVPQAAIVAHIESLHGPFRLGEVLAATGATPATATAAVGQMITAGTLRRLGPDPEHNGRGRAPFLYERP
jgi:hypothetical protein